MGRGGRSGEAQIVYGQRNGSVILAAQCCIMASRPLAQGKMVGALPLMVVCAEAKP